MELYDGEDTEIEMCGVLWEDDAPGEDAQEPDTEEITDGEDGLAMGGGRGGRGEQSLSWKFCLLVVVIAACFLLLDAFIITLGIKATL